MSAAPDVSVIVAVRDGMPGIATLLVLLGHQTLPRERYEVVVVDDGSRDGTAEAARASGLARLVSLPESRGSYGARNAGLEVARGAVIATTDADCRPAPDWLERGLAELERTGADLVGGHVEVPLGPRPSLAEALDVARFLDQQRAVERLGFAATANLFVRREALERIGRFDERLTSGGDVELCSRATAAGLRLVYCAAAVVVHPPRTTARELARKALRVGTGMGQMRHHGVGPWGARRPPWSMPRAWLPSRGVLGAERLERHGHRPSGARALALDAAQYALVHVPILAGQLAAQARLRRAR
jgi:cellulose synthase/poly-beta-1,6-N-acetylglucosamine synthase-like glycosyltransferase